MFFQVLVDGVLIGGVYATIGLGLSLAFGIMDIINWAAGETLMVGMYLSFALIKFGGLDPYLCIPIVMLVLGLFGICLQKFVFNKMQDRAGKRSTFNILLFTAGLGMALSNLANALFSGESYAVTTRYTGKSFILGDVFISKPKLISFALAVIIMIVLYIVIRRTELGRAIRATAQDFYTAQLMAIDSRRIFVITFAISLALVGCSAALLMPFYSVAPFIGSTFSFKALVIVALGGKGNIPGTLVGGILLGVIEKFSAMWLNDSYAQIIVFLIFILVLLLRPNGLLNRKPA